MWMNVLFQIDHWKPSKVSETSTPLPNLWDEHFLQRKLKDELLLTYPSGLLLFLCTCILQRCSSKQVQLWSPLHPPTMFIQKVCWYQWTRDCSSTKEKIVAKKLISVYLHHLCDKLQEETSIERFQFVWFYKCCCCCCFFAS